MTPIKYMNVSEIRYLFNFAETFKKSSHTLLRLPFPAEIGTTLITYVRDTAAGSFRKESESVIQSDHVIACNPDAIGMQHSAGLGQRLVYNEWPITRDVVIRNYGEDVSKKLTTEFMAAEKVASIKALQVNRTLLDILHIDGDILPISVDWSTEPMIAKIGDYITDQGYSIANENIRAYYWKPVDVEENHQS